MAGSTSAQCTSMRTYSGFFPLASGSTIGMGLVGVAAPSPEYSYPMPSCGIAGGFSSGFWALAAASAAGRITQHINERRLARTKAPSQNRATRLARLPRRRARARRGRMSRRRRPLPSSQPSYNGPMSTIGIFLAAPVRTPIGRFGGGLASLTAAELGGLAAREAIRRAGIDPAEIGHTVFGNARQAGGGPTPARQIGRRAGLPDASPAFTVNMACASGLQAILSAAQVVRQGDAEIVLAGGTESMSRVPYLLDRARFGYR